MTGNDSMRRHIPSELEPVLLQGVLNLAIKGVWGGPVAEAFIAKHEKINADYDEWLKDFWGG